MREELEKLLMMMVFLIPMIYLLQEQMGDFTLLVDILD